MLKKILIVIVLLGLAYLAYTQFFSPEAGQGGDKMGGGPPSGFAMPVEAVRLSQETLNVELETVGSLRADESVVLRPEMPGRVDTITFTEGTPVEKNTVLIQLDDRLAAAEVKQAEAQLQLARVSHRRAAALRQSGAVAQNRLDTADADLAIAEANAQLARTMLDKTRIRAPFNGMVGLRRISPGEYVTTGQELATVERFHPMKVDFTLPEVEASRVRGRPDAGGDDGCSAGSNFYRHCLCGGADD